MSAQSFRSVPEMFLHRVKATPMARAFQHPTANDGWAWLTWNDAHRRVRAIGCGLLSLGIEPEQRCAIQSSTRYEWILADLGILCAGAATTTIYPSTSPEDCAFILGDSACRFAIVEDASQVQKLASQRDKLGSLERLIVIDGEGGHDGWVITLAELERLGQEFDREHPDRFDEVVQAIEPSHLATLIYTSGTTGQPKGVELTHDCWVFEGQAVAALGLLLPTDHQYLWLPLSHSFGKVLQVTQLTVGLPTTVDGRIPKLIENLAVVRPTFMAAAPRIFEKVYNKVVTSTAEAGGLKYKIFKWAVAVGRQVSRLQQQGRPLPLVLAAQRKVADRLVFSKLRDRFGGRLRFFLSGSAPLSLEMAEFFHGAGILILEGYGLTETSAGTFVNRLDDYRFGTVGKAIGTTEVKIAEEDGEILLRGRGVMRGYHNLPDATREVLTEDGWLHTGDIGELDRDGFLKITDRKKDLIKTSGGKYVAPQLLEGKLKALCPYLGHVLVHGDRRNYCSALVTVDEEAITAWAKDNQVNQSYGELTANPQVRELIQRAINELNGQLASYETIKKFAVLPADFAVETGELTPSLKVKRKVVEKKYQDILDGFYSDAMQSV